jgi:hypothetical protein
MLKSPNNTWRLSNLVLSKLIVLATLSLLCSFEVLGQRDAHWVLGFDYKSSKEDSLLILDFRDQPYSFSTFHTPTVQGSVFFGIDIAPSVISTEQGELLYYSDGMDIRNRFHELVENGGEMFNFQFANIWHGSMFLPLPGHPDSILFITQKWQLSGNADRCYDLNVSLIDSKANAGRGKVVDKNHVFNQDTLACGAFHAVQHANGRDWWFLISDPYDNKWYSYLLTTEGLIAQPEFQMNMPALTASWHQTSFSPDGNWFARYFYFYEGGFLDTYHFDRCTGQLSNFKRSLVKQPPNCWGGVAFSPSSKYLYVSAADSIFQYDMDVPDFESTKALVGAWDSLRVDMFPFDTSFQLLMPRDFFHANLAADGKIYISCSGQTSNYMHVTQKPDEKASNCQFEQRGLLHPYIVGCTFPKMPHYRMGALVGSICDTLTIQTSSPEHFSGFSLFPNPTSEVLFLEIHENTWVNHPKIDLHCLDINGKAVLVQELSLTSSQVDIKHLPDGVYQVHFIGQNGILSVQKLVVLRE